MITNVQKIYDMVDGTTLVGYKMTLSNGEIGDVPLDETNRDYVAIQEWIADGNTVSEPE